VVDSLPEKLALKKERRKVGVAAIEQLAKKI
jgi:hypothetical protein